MLVDIPEKMAVAIIQLAIISIFIDLVIVVFANSTFSTFN